MDEALRDPAVALNRTIGFNLETAGLYALVSCFFVPTLRHWWCILPAAWRGVILLAWNYSQLREFLSQRSVLTPQIKYLTEHPIGTLPSHADTSAKES